MYKSFTKQTKKMSITKNKWFALAILLTAPFLSVVDVFIINIAIPSIQKGVHASDGEYSWL